MGATLLAVIAHAVCQTHMRVIIIIIIIIILNKKKSTDYTGRHSTEPSTLKFVDMTNKLVVPTSTEAQSLVLTQCEDPAVTG
jgi:hypothetical protein